MVEVFGILSVLFLLCLGFLNAAACARSLSRFLVWGVLSLYFGTVWLVLFAEMLLL